MAECDAQHIPAHVGIGTTIETTQTGTGATGSETSAPTHVGAASPPKPARATQAIPPAVRRAVMTRDGRRCVVPGCRHATWLDTHHIDPKAEGGDHDPDNLVCLCGAHHLAVHRGDLVIDGRVSSGLTFRHADGTRYGGPVSPHAADVQSTVFRAMRGLGFREGDARRAVERAATHVGDGASAETLLRAALSGTAERG
jgi:hypothetical protein